MNIKIYAVNLNPDEKGYNADGCYYCCRNAHKG